MHDRLNQTGSPSPTVESLSAQLAQLQREHAQLQARHTQSIANLADVQAQLAAQKDEHRNSLTALRESDERLRIALGAGQMGTWEIDVQTWEVRRSENTDRLFGLAAGGPSRPLSDYFECMYPDDRDAVQERLRQGIEKGGEQYVEYRVLLPDGQRVWLASRGALAEGSAPGGRVFAGATMDLTRQKQVEDALRDSEERYRMLFGRNPQPMWLNDIDTLRIEEVNDAAVKFYGYSREEFQSMTILDIRPPQEVERLKNYLAGGLKDLDSHGIWQHLKKDGTVVSVEIASHTVALRDKKARLILAKDVTDRLKAEEELRRIHLDLEERVEARTAELERKNQMLRESEELFRQIAENIGEVFWMTNVDKSRMIYVSPAYEQIWGRSCASLYEKPASFLDAILPEDRPRVVGNLPDQARCETTTTYRVQTLDGTLHWIRDRSFPIRNTQGEIYRIAGIAENITELKKTEEELSLLASIPESSDDAIIGKSPDGRIISWNHGARRLYGYTAAEMIGQSSLILTSPKLRPEAEALLARVARGETVRTIETERLRRDGERMSVSLSLSAVRNAEGVVFAICCIERDITERKRLEQEILEIGEREQQRIGRDLHDGLGQQLIGVSCLAKALHRDLTAQNRGEAREVGQISELVQDAIGLTRQIARGLHPVYSAAGGLMSALTEMATWAQTAYRLSCQLICPTPVLVNDNNVATHLYRIAQEALTNAAKHGKASAIKLILEASPQLNLRIEDDGVGIKGPAVKCGPDIPASLPPPEQCGMGLRTMSYRAGIIGAALSIERGPRGGTVVTCRVPMANPVAAQPPRTSKSVSKLEQAINGETHASQRTHGHPVGKRVRKPKPSGKRS